PMADLPPNQSAQQTAPFTAPGSTVILDGQVTASTIEAGTKEGASLRVIVGCDVPSIAPLDPDPNPFLSVVEEGGQVIRYYKVIDRRNGHPIANASVTLHITGPGVDKTSAYTTNADGHIVTAGTEG